MPTHTNKSALNIACVRRWKKASWGEFRPSAAIITPSWLSVEYATIFFISVSKRAVSAAISMVRQLIVKRVKLYIGICWRVGARRIIRKTPAVTKVDEWTRAETGVGAAIAMGSQGENGNCALLVIAARRVAKRRG